MWHGICFACKFIDSVGYPSRKESRYGWNRIPREHSMLTEEEYLVGTGQAWFQQPRRKRAKWFKEHNIAYDPKKLVPLDPKIRSQHG